MCSLPHVYLASWTKELINLWDLQTKEILNLGVATALICSRDKILVWTQTCSTTALSWGRQPHNREAWQTAFSSWLVNLVVVPVFAQALCTSLGLYPLLGILPANGRVLPAETPDLRYYKPDWQHWIFACQAICVQVQIHMCWFPINLVLHPTILTMIYQDKEKQQSPLGFYLHGKSDGKMLQIQEVEKFC